jgi:hypothetical protein
MPPDNDAYELYWNGQKMGNQGGFQLTEGESDNLLQVDSSFVVDPRSAAHIYFVYKGGRLRVRKPNDWCEADRESRKDIPKGHSKWS